MSNFIEHHLIRLTDLRLQIDATYSVSQSAAEFWNKQELRKSLRRQLESAKRSAGEAGVHIDTLDKVSAERLKKLLKVHDELLERDKRRAA